MKNTVAKRLTKHFGGVTVYRHPGGVAEWILTIPRRSGGVDTHTVAGGVDEWLL